MPTEDPATAEIADVLAGLTWAARDPEGDPWTLGVGSDASWHVDLGIEGRAIGDNGFFGVIASDRANGTIGIGDPATRTVVTMPVPMSGPGATRRLGLRVDPTGTWLIVHAGEAGWDGGVLAVDPRTSEQRVIVPEGKLPADHVRNLLLMSASGNTVASTVCSMEECLVDLVDVAKLSARHLDAPFPAIAITDRFAVGHLALGDAWSVLELASGKITVLPIDRAAQVATVVPLDDARVVLDAFVDHVYRIVLVDLATGELTVIHEEPWMDDGPQSAQLMKLPSQRARYVAVSAAATFSDALALLERWPEVRLLDTETGTISGAALRIGP